MSKKKNPQLMEIAKRLEILREKKSLSKAKMAKILGVSPTNYYPYIKGKISLGVEKIQKILEYFPDINPRWLLLGEDPIFLRDIEEHRKQLPKLYPIKFYKNTYLTTDNGTLSPDKEDTIPILVSESFTKFFFKTSPRGIFLFPVVGNSMEPTIPNGSIAIAKKSEFEKNFFEGAIYILIYDNELFIKRVRKRKLPEGTEWKLISDNPKYDSIVFLDTEDTNTRFELIGRVLGFIKSFS